MLTWHKSRIVCCNTDALILGRNFTVTINLACQTGGWLAVVSNWIADRHSCNPSNVALREKIQYCNTCNKTKLANGARAAPDPSPLASQSLSSPYPFPLRSLAQPHLLCHSSFHATQSFFLPFLSFSHKGSLSTLTQYSTVYQSCPPYLCFSHIQGF